MTIKPDIIKLTSATINEIELFLSSSLICTAMINRVVNATIRANENTTTLNKIQVRDTLFITLQINSANRAR